MGSPVYHWAQVVPTHLTYRGKLFAEPRGRVEANNEPSQPRESRAGAALYWSKPEQSADQPSAAHAAHTGIKTDTKTDANKGENTDKIQIRFRYKIMDTNRVTIQMSQLTICLQVTQWLNIGSSAYTERWLFDVVMIHVNYQKTKDHSAFRIHSE